MIYFGFKPARCISILAKSLQASVSSKHPYIAWNLEVVFMVVNAECVNVLRTSASSKLGERRTWVKQNQEKLNLTVVVLGSISRELIFVTIDQ